MWARARAAVEITEKHQRPKTRDAAEYGDLGFCGVSEMVGPGVWQRFQPATRGFRATLVAGQQSGGYLAHANSSRRSFSGITEDVDCTMGAELRGRWLSHSSCFTPANDKDRHAHRQARAGYFPRPKDDAATQRRAPPRGGATKLVETY